MITNVEFKNGRALEWRPIEGFEGYYAISNYGEVLSIRRNKILKPSTSGRKRNYLNVTLRTPTQKKLFRIHRLVAHHFIAPAQPRLEVNHKDGNPSNNFVGNLEWVTTSQNELHAYAIGLKCAKGERNSQHKLTEREVSFIRYLRGLYPYIKTCDIASFYKMTNTRIWEILSFKGWNYLPDADGSLDKGEWEMKLLPCPFCGSKAILEDDLWRYHVRCDSQGNCGVNPSTYDFKDKLNAIKEWNTRAGKDRTPKEEK